MEYGDEVLVPPDQRKPTTTESTAHDAAPFALPPAGFMTVVFVDVELNSPACASFAKTPKLIATITPDTKKRIKTARNRDF
jgi:hypothetical protein